VGSGDSLQSMSLRKVRQGGRKRKLACCSCERRQARCWARTPLLWLLVASNLGAFFDGIPWFLHPAMILRPPRFFVTALDTKLTETDSSDSSQLSRSSVRGALDASPAKENNPSPTPLTLNQIFFKAGKRGLGGGIPGAVAGVVQVVTLMWLRTIMSYQSRYGGTFAQALTTLLNEGGIARLYKGWYFGLIQAPVTRFVSTAANDGVESLLSSLKWTKAWGPGRSTIVASIFVGLFRMILMRKCQVPCPPTGCWPLITSRTYWTDSVPYCSN
jgi:hypothetical protein